MICLTPIAADLLSIFAVPLAAGSVVALIFGMSIMEDRADARAYAKEKAALSHLH